MSYVDAFVMPVIAAREAEYQAWARLAHQVWLDHGALSYVEARADDVPHGQVTSFPRALLLEEGEIAYVAFATYRDRAHRDAVMALVTADPRVQDAMRDPPAAMMRLIFGGFTVVTP